VDPEIQMQYASFFKDSRVKCFGILPRSELAKRMASAEVFVFPSLAEGSARVVFEALSSGCYVITTPNSGSIVEDGVYGALVPPNDADALANAIRQAIRQRAKLPEIGLKSADLVRSNYQQVHYGEALIRLYERLLEGKISGNLVIQ
jgi:glycosyltransferase involved in cell wall biosynthesis